MSSRQSAAHGFELGPFPEFLVKGCVFCQHTTLVGMRMSDQRELFFGFVHEPKLAIAVRVTHSPFPVHVSRARMRLCFRRAAEMCGVSSVRGGVRKHGVERG